MRYLEHRSTLNASTLASRVAELVASRVAELAARLSLLYNVRVCFSAATDKCVLLLIGITGLLDMALEHLCMQGMMAFLCG